MKRILILCLLGTAMLASCTDQKKELPKEASVQVIAAEQSLLFKPTDVKALMVVDFTLLPEEEKVTSSPIHREAVERGVSILYTSCSEYFPDLFLDDAGPSCLDDVIHQVLLDEGWEEFPVFVGGLSAQGTRALRYAAYCASGKSAHGSKVKGVFVVDAPLDLERFYRAEDLHGERFINGMEQEAVLVMNVLAERLGGTPDEADSAYHAASVFTHDQKGGGNAHHLLQTPIIFYTEPDMNWWIDERNATYFDINAYDIAACTRFLRANGNQDVTLNITSGKGYDQEGNRKPHSWSIVDETALIKWMLDRI